MSKSVGDAVGRTVRALERRGCPQDAICHHLGVHEGSVSNLSIGISDRDGMLLVTLYHRDAKTFPSARTHRRRAQAVAAALKCRIKETWNGGDGHCGISVVLSRRAPKALVRATDNYARMRDVFNPTESEKENFAAFDAWFASCTAKQKSQEKPAR